MLIDAGIFAPAHTRTEGNANAAAEKETDRKTDGEGVSLVFLP